MWVNSICVEGKLNNLFYVVIILVWLVVVMVFLIVMFFLFCFGKICVFVVIELDDINIIWIFCVW